MEGSILVKLFLKNKKIKNSKNQCEIKVRTILVCALYSIKYCTFAKFWHDLSFPIDQKVFVECLNLTLAKVLQGTLNEGKGSVCFFNIKSS